MNEKPLNQVASFRDLYISAFLKAQGFPLHNATLDERGRTIFHFMETPELIHAIRNYYSGNASVNATAFVEAYRSLRGLAYNLSEPWGRGNLNEKG